MSLVERVCKCVNKNKTRQVIEFKDIFCTILHNCQNCINFIENSQNLIIISENPITKSQASKYSGVENNWKKF